MKIMIVDDELGIRLIVRRILKNAGYEVVEAESGEECLAKIENEKPDLILMDVMMPGIDGWEATKRIKNNEATKHIPIAMLTIKSEEEDIIKSFQEAGANAHIDKPIIKEKMLGTIDWILKTLPKRAEK